MQNTNEDQARVITKNDCIKIYEALCSKHNVSDGDKELFIEIMMFRKMDAYEYLCDKYKMSDDDRDALAGSVLLANQLTCLYDQTNDERKYV